MRPYMRPIDGPVFEPGSVGWQFEFDPRSWLIGVYLSSQEFEVHFLCLSFYHWQEKPGDRAKMIAKMRDVVDAEDRTLGKVKNG